MSELIHVGVDPGKTGAVAGIRGREVLFVHDCPLTRGVLDVPRLAAIVRALALKYPELHCTIEEVGTFRRDGRAGAFTFGGNFFAWQSAFAAMNVPVLLAPPKKWKKGIIGPKPGKDKIVSIRTCHFLFPGSRAVVDMPPPGEKPKHDGRAEAILLAEFGRRAMQERGLVDRFAKFKK